eukprot:Colp12_sorted_trinity150504_noHs@24569
MRTYGRIVPPHAPHDLGYAIMEVLSMTGGLEQIVDPSAPYVSLESFRGKPELLTQRMQDATIKMKRRNLGLRLRARVFKVFPIQRYLREHEQLMWIAAMQSSGATVQRMVRKYAGVQQRAPHAPLAVTTPT